ncbi:hypothetical protein DFJ77DRAFT_468178 [Powellomyces hirtus]|nr:hypothetical protein DFJ77DRAFT_468178 [Powellomyces hirtus]
MQSRRTLLSWLLLFVSPAVLANKPFPTTCSPGVGALPAMGFRVMWDTDVPIISNNTPGANRAHERIVSAASPCRCATLCGDPKQRCDWWAWTGDSNGDTGEALVDSVSNNNSNTTTSNTTTSNTATSNTTNSNEGGGSRVKDTPSIGGVVPDASQDSQRAATCYLRTLPPASTQATLRFRSSPDYSLLAALPTATTQIISTLGNVTLNKCVDSCLENRSCVYLAHITKPATLCTLYAGIAKPGTVVGVWDPRVPALDPPPPNLVVVTGHGQKRLPWIITAMFVAVALGCAGVLAGIAAFWWKRRHMGSTTRFAWRRKDCAVYHETIQIGHP